MLNKILYMIAELLWKYIEPRINKACEEGYKRGEVSGYVAGYDDGYMASADDITRRIGQVYQIVADKAKADVYTDAGAIPIEEVDEALSQTVFEGVE